ncbi:hypothetical protein HanRHA438_Chr11g0487271 [Helianthus annuus]|nr:hypothetical protein HanRHA438_Chr11g0487271 [Helianthus annuus]
MENKNKGERRWKLGEEDVIDGKHKHKQTIEHHHHWKPPSHYHQYCRQIERKF